MIGQQLGPYRVSARIGAGGMGVVWRAHDERLGREVALKVLPDALVADPAARARLLREARAASALNHPNILTVHEVGESGEHVYIVTEFVPGKPLSEAIPPGGLPVETVLRYGVQVADALAHAHEHGVIHRDIKASNVLVTPDGRAKVLDFGLARVALAGGEAAQAATLTAPGVLQGTPLAMAPEQWRGAPADAKSDVWSLGVLLHTMLAGKPPFDGANAFAISAAILGQPPAPLPAHVPPALAAVVARCLAKDPLQRWRSAAEVRAALEAIAAGSGPVAAPAHAAPGRRHVARPIALGAAAVLAAIVAVLVGTGRVRLPGAGAHGPTGITSLAVLPLDNFSRDPDQLYFADGITEELTTRLAQIGALRVTSRTSAMRFRGSTESLPAIARQLGVDAVIEGSVERAGDRVRITAQLVRANDVHLWARSYERDMKDALALQDEVAGAIVAEIQGKLVPARTVPAAREVSPAVYQAYLLGRTAYERWTAPDERRAVAFFDEALRHDSTYAPAWAGRALALQWLGVSPDTAALARASAERALALDPTLSEAHATLGLLLMERDWDWAGADREFRRAIELNPSNVDARHQYSHLLMARGRASESIAQARIGLSLDPLSPAMLGHMAWLAFLDDRRDSVDYWVRRALAVDPTYASAVEHAVDLDLGERRWPEWKAGLVRLRQLGESIDPLSLQLADTFAARRSHDALHLVEAIESPADTFPHAPGELAAFELVCGRPDSALAWIERGVAIRSYDMIYADRDPRLAELRNDPRLLAIRRRIGLAP